jgi:hypothetical protein
VLESPSSLASRPRQKKTVASLERGHARCDTARGLTGSTELTTHVCLYGHCRAVVACRLCGSSAGTSPVLLSSCTTTSLVPPASRSPPPRPASSLQRCRGCGSYTGRVTIPWSVATWQDNGCRHVLWTPEIYHDIRLEGCILI